MAALKSGDHSLEIEFLGIADDDEELIVATVGLLCDGVPILNDAFCIRMHSGKAGYFEFWQDGRDRLVEFLLERIARNDEGLFAPQDESDFYLLVVPGYGFPFVQGSSPRTGSDMGEPTFTLLLKPAQGVLKTLGAEYAYGQGVIQQLHVTRDELANFAVSLQDELFAALRVQVPPLPDRGSDQTG